VAPRRFTISRVPRTRVKICGITRPEDARLASDAGADAIGMIFHPSSRRNISVETARQIVAVLGPFVTPVGVFVDATTDTIVSVATSVGLRVVQLHGHEPVQQVAELGRANLKVIKVLRVDDTLESQLDGWRASGHLAAGVLLGIVLETAGVAGGSGVPNDFPAILRHQQLGHLADFPALILAGGLTPENVGEVVRTLHPWAVDVSSGVETELGRKDRAKMMEFAASVDSASRAR